MRQVSSFASAQPASSPKPKDHDPDRLAPSSSEWRSGQQFSLSKDVTRSASHDSRDPERA